MDANKNQIKGYINDLKSIHCIYCNSNLMMKYLNHSQQITLCSNKNVSLYLFKIFLFIYSVYFH